MMSCIFSSRDREFLSMQLAGSAGCFPPVFACFNNGVVYKFAKGRGVTYHDVVKPDFIRELTSKLHALHNVDLESARVFNRNGESTTFGCNPDPFGRMAAFIRKIPQSLKNPERDSQLKRYRTVLTNEVLWGELKYLKSLLAKSNLPLSFVHNDFHPGNIVIDDTTGTVTIVDYEFVSFGYEYTDLSALLLQRNCIVAAKLVPPDVPEITDETRQMYIIAYENAKCNNEFDSIDDERMDVLQKQYRLADLANLGFYMASYMAISDVEGLDVFLDAVEGIRAKYYDLKKLLAEQDHEKE